MSMGANILSPLEQNLKNTLDQAEKCTLCQSRYSSSKCFSDRTPDHGSTSDSLQYTVDICNCMPKKQKFP